jgi:hypothetical protein
VPSTVIVLIELGWWNKLFSSKATLLPVWSHHSKNYTYSQARLRCSQFEVITPKIIRSWSWTGWPLWNINISNDDWYFSFYISFLFLLSPKILDYEKQERPTLREDLSSPPVFWWVRVARHVSFVLYVFVFFLSSCCVLYPFFPLSALSYFYLKLNKQARKYQRGNQ